MQKPCFTLFLRSRIWDYIHSVISVYVKKIIKPLHMCSFIHSLLERKVIKYLRFVHSVCVGYSHSATVSWEDYETTVNECHPSPHSPLAGYVDLHSVSHTYTSYFIMRLIYVSLYIINSLRLWYYLIINT